MDGCRVHVVILGQLKIFFLCYWCFSNTERQDRQEVFQKNSTLLHFSHMSELSKKNYFLPKFHSDKPVQIYILYYHYLSYHYYILYFEEPAHPGPHHPARPTFTPMRKIINHRWNKQNDDYKNNQSQVKQRKWWLQEQRFKDECKTVTETKMKRWIHRITKEAGGSCQKQWHYYVLPFLEQIVILLAVRRPLPYLWARIKDYTNLQEWKSFLILCSSYQEGTGADKEIAETKEKVERFSFCTNEVLLNEASPDVHPVCFGHK